MKLGSYSVQSFLKTLLVFFAGILIVILMWEMLALYCNTGGTVMRFPTPAESFERTFEWLLNGETLYGHTIYQHILRSLKRWLIAFIMASGAGVVLGSILGYFDRIYSVGIVPVTVLQTIPGLAWIPIAILLFGLGDDAAIFMIFIVSFMVITINVAGGIRMVPETVLRAGGMMGASSSILFLKILLPYASVSIINGLRVGMGSAWRVLIAAEMLIGSGIGLGASMELLRYNLDFIGAFACIIIICAIGLTVDRFIFAEIEKRVRHRLGMEEGY